MAHHRAALRYSSWGVSGRAPARQRVQAVNDAVSESPAVPGRPGRRGDHRDAAAREPGNRPGPRLDGPRCPGRADHPGGADCSQGRRRSVARAGQARVR